MTNQIAVKDDEREIRFDTWRGEVALNLAVVKRMCPKATDSEAFMFMQFCKHMGINPYIGEAYLIKYSDNDPAQPVIGKETFTQRAERQGNLEYMRAGVIFADKDGVLTEVQGTVGVGTLVGGWARVKRTDQAEEHYLPVDFAEYNTSRAQWKSKPKTMIRKVALVQTLREAYPSQFTGMFDESEMPEIVVEGDKTPIGQEVLENNTSIEDMTPEEKTQASMNLIPPKD